LHALKVGLAGVLALFFAEALRLQFPQWSLFTVMVLMIVQYPGSIALKSLFRFVGTLIGASLGVWVVSDYTSAPFLFLSVTFLVMSFASYKAGRLGPTMAPYGYLASGDTAIISLMGNEDLPFRGTVRSMGWGIFVTDGSSGQSTALLPSVSPTIDWVRLPQRFPVRIQVDSSAPTELRIGQTASVAISHGPQSVALHNRLTSIRSGQLSSSIGSLK